MSTDTLRRVARCFAVSVGSTVLSTTILIGLALGLGVAAGLANVVAVCCGIVPSYVANRRWVWRRDGRGSLANEAMPYVAMSLVGLLASTLAVARVADLSASWPTHWRAVALPASNLAVFGALWCVQFVVLDRLIFPARRRPAAQLGEA
jgi:putative flippase GtrA